MVTACWMARTGQRCSLPGMALRYTVVVVGLSLVLERRSVRRRKGGCPSSSTRSWSGNSAWSGQMMSVSC
ncbi:hypothetical protein BCR44DRAFT_1448437, partial [Catenaria anguillulae PL171]